MTLKAFAGLHVLPIVDSFVCEQFRSRASRLQDRSDDAGECFVAVAEMTRFLQQVAEIAGVFGEVSGIRP